jgi:hypothetical protein
MVTFQNVIRVATPNDSDAIFGVLKAIAPTIPLKLEDPERREKVRLA